MAEKTGIGWTDHTFNPWWGCAKVSPGCAHCYAETLAKRYGHSVWGEDNPARRTFGEKHWTEPLKWNAKAEKDGVRRRVFCASMADVFEDHPVCNAERPKLWPLIRATPWLDWLLLTKRPENINGMLPDDWGVCYPNVWMGTSIENQRHAHRADVLRGVRAAVRFISAEPLLGDLDLTPLFETLPPEEVWWLIAGGESGPDGVRREMDIAWIESLRAQCGEFGVWFYAKQDSGRRDSQQGRIPDDIWVHEWPTLERTYA